MRHKLALLINDLRRNRHDAWIQQWLRGYILGFADALDVDVTPPTAWQVRRIVDTYFS